MKRIYNLLFVFITLTFCGANVLAQTAVDSLRFRDLRIKESKPDNNWSNNTGTAKFDFENDIVAQISQDSISLTYENIDKVEVRLSFKTITATGTAELFDMDPNWDATTITWTSASTLTTATTPFASFDLTEIADTAVVYFDITDWFKAKYALGSNFGYRMVAKNDAINATETNSYNASWWKQPTIFVYTSETSTGIGEVDLSDFNIYPNPAQDYVVISFKDYENSTVMISNIIGNQLYASKLESESTRIDISNLSSGLYMVSVKNNNKIIATSKLYVK